MANLPDFDLWVRLCLKYEIHVLDEPTIRSRRVGEESNASGDNAMTRRRTRFESKQLLNHYLELTTGDHLLAVFPEAGKYGRITDDIVPFFLARTAIDTHVGFLQLWGLEVLWDFLENNENAQKVEQNCGFTYRDYIDLSGAADVFNLSSFEATHGPGNRRRLLFFARDFLTRVVPPGSRRERVSRNVDRTLRLWRAEGTLAFVQWNLQRLAQLPYYQLWILRNQPRGRKLQTQRALAEVLPYRPLISIIMPVYNVDLSLLKAAVDSVELQTYGNWELCIADDASSQSHIRPYLERISAADARVKVVFRKENGHISRASNSAIEPATGEFLCTLDNDDILYPHALFKFVERLNERPELDIIYADSDLVVKICRKSPAFKPDWSPDLFYSNNYLNHPTLLRKTLVDEVGGFRPGLEGSQDYDLYLRVLARTDATRISHIREVLYGWRSTPGSAAADPNNKDYATDAGQRALSSALNIDHLVADVRPGIIKNTYYPRYLVRGNPRVSVIIAHNQQPSSVRACLEAFYEYSGYANYEIVVMGNELPDLPGSYKVEFLDCDVQQSRARVLNDAVAQARGQYILFLDSKVKLLTPQSLPAMLGSAQRREIGTVGPKILFRGETIYSAGIILGRNNDLFAHVFHGRSDLYDWYAANTLRNYLALSDLCFLVGKDKFQEVQGYDDQFGPGILSHLDFCLKLNDAGHRNLFTPFVAVYNQTPGEEPFDGSGAERFRARWHRYLQCDPYYSPNLSRKKADFSI
jgi:O-antigen biosynthesis protein